MKQNVVDKLNTAFASVTVSLISLAFIAGLMVGSANQHRIEQQFVNCYEDEVIIWRNDSHSTCWPVDDLWMLVEVE